MEEKKIAFVCTSCGKKYRLKGSLEELREDLLFCPECGGKLTSISGEDSKTLSPLKKGILEDLLISGPIALIYWDLQIPQESVIGVLEKENYVIKRFTDRESFRYWLRLFIPEVVVWGTENDSLVSIFEEMLRELPMEDYRKIFRVRIASKYQTLEPIQIFLTGVHLVCNPQDLSRFEDIYRKAREYWKVLYTPYYHAYESLKKEGGR